MRSAKMALRMMSRIMIPPLRAARLRTRRPKASCHRLRLLCACACSAARWGVFKVAAIACPLLVPDARIEEPINDIDHQVGEYQESGIQENRSHDDRIIAVGDAGDEV